MKFKAIFSAFAILLALSCQAQQPDYGFGVFPRVTQARTYSGFFPLTGRDYARNAFLPIISGADTVVYYCDAYGRFVSVKSKPDGNGIYGGSGTVPSNVLATITNRIRFLGADDFGADYPFKIQSDGNEPGILSLKANNDSLTFARSDVEFLIDGGPGLGLNSSRGNTDVSAEGGFLSLGEQGGDSLKVYTNGSLSMTVDNANNVGIGTDNPQYPLHVRGDILLGYTLIEDDGNQLLLRQREQSDYALFQNQYGITRVAGATIGFLTGGTERIKINGAEIGIGTVSPTQGLDIATNVRTRNVQIADIATITGTGGAIALSTTITDNLYKPGADQANATFVLPPSPADGQLCRLTFFNEVNTTLSFNFGGSGSFGGFPADAKVGASMLFKFYTGSGWTLVANKG